MRQAVTKKSGYFRAEKSSTDSLQARPNVARPRCAQIKPCALHATIPRPRRGLEFLSPWTYERLLTASGSLDSALQGYDLVHCDGALCHHLVHIAVTQSESKIQPHTVADDLGGEAVPFEGARRQDTRQGIHRPIKSWWRQVDNTRGPK